MRIISQDGKWDLPYDNTSLYLTELCENGGICCGYIICGHCLQLQKGQKVAEYKTKEKAEKAMEMLHEKFNLFELQKVVTKDTNDSIIASLGTLTGVSKFFNYFFQFPADEEIEV